MIHELKIEQPYFEAVLSGDKTFEIRYNDRGFQKGDGIRLREITLNGYCTDRTWYGKITYVSTYQQKENFVVFGIKKT